MERANANQLANRNIKPIKARRARPITSNSAAPQSMSFGAFGGAQDGGGSFNFSAPGGPSISFPPTNNPFANVSSPEHSENESNGHRLDLTGEEAKRKNKTFRPEPAAAQSIFGGPQQPTANPFNFAASQPAATTFFGSGPSQDKPVANPFNFGTSQSTAPAAPVVFGATPSQEKPSANIFNFGASQPAASTPPINFFGSASTQAPAGNNVFAGFGQQTPKPATPANLFGSSAPSEKPLFAFGGSSSIQDTSSEVKPATTPFDKPFVFGGASSTAAPSSSVKPTTSASTNPFNFLGGQAAQPTSTMFGNSPSAPSSTSNMFGASNQSSTPSTSNIFGGASQSNNLFKPSTEAAAQSPFNNASQSQAPPTTNLFGSSNKPADTAPEKPSGGSLFDRVTKDDNGKSLFQSPSTNGVDTTANTPAKSLFGTGDMGKVNTQQQSLPAGGLFGSLGKPATSTANLFNNLNKSFDQSAAGPKVNGSIPNGAQNGHIFNSSGTTQAPTANIFGAPQTAPPSALPSVFGSTQVPLSEVNGNKSSPPFNPNDLPASASQPPPNGMFPSLQQPSQAMPNSSLNHELGSSNIANASNSRTSALSLTYPEMAAASAITDEEINDKVPGYFSQKQRKEFYTAFRIRSLNRAIAAFFNTVAASQDVNEALTYYKELRETISGRGSGSALPNKVMNGETKQNGSHAASSGFPAPVPSKSENRSPGKTFAKPSQSSVNGSTAHKSSPMVPAAQASLPNPTPIQSHSSTNGSTTPKAPPPSFPPVAAAQPSSPSKSKRKAEEQLTKDIVDAGERDIKKSKTTPHTNGGSTGSNTSNIFKNILESPAKRPTATPASQRSSGDEQPRPNPFAALPLPASAAAKPATPKLSNDEKPRPNPFAALPVSAQSSPALTTNNLFAPKPTSAMPNFFSSTKPAPEASSTSATNNIFASKPTDTNNSLFSSKQAPSNSSTPKPATATSTLKMPTFGSGPVNFMAQFSQNAAKSQEDFEKKLFEDHKAKEYDSDDSEGEDLETFTAKYQAKRDAEKKEIEDIKKNKQVTFDPKNGFKDAAAAEKATPSPNNSIFGSANISRTSTPSIFQAPSILAGSKAAQGMPQSSNIFGHLTPSSAVDSGNDDDDDSGDEIDGDSENKDPSYRPGADDSGHGTPVEATGAGISSVKKPLSSIFGAPKSSPLFDKSISSSSVLDKSVNSSGTSTPSLFDRISKDENGNPIRQLSSDEKENTKPSTTTSIFGNTSNPFGNSFGKSSSGPTDQTWKPESPIKFASSTQSNPSVSVTAATPTKPESLFNIPPKQISPFANLFGSSTTQKPSSMAPGVGFSFGGLSAASSLLPSAAVSANTSRATTPGGTTDGESETDPDAEKHEQIDLAAGGPGEEDEEVMYEIRAKALLFCKGEDQPWSTKGVGPFRILKNKETDAIRILLRQDPSGTVVINHSILPQAFKSDKKTVKMMLSGTGGLQTWLLQVKTDESAKALADALESNKPSDS